MTFRSRLLLGFAATAAVPLVVLAIGVRREAGARPTPRAGARRRPAPPPRRERATGVRETSPAARPRPAKAAAPGRATAKPGLERRSRPARRATVPPASTMVSSVTSAAYRL